VYYERIDTIVLLFAGWAVNGPQRSLPPMNEVQ